MLSFEVILQRWLELLFARVLLGAPRQPSPLLVQLHVYILLPGRSSCLRISERFLSGLWRRRSSTTTVDRWSRPSRSSHTPTRTSWRTSWRSSNTKCFSRETTSSRKERSATRCISFKKALSTSLPKTAKSQPASRTAPISEVGLLL